MKSCSVLVILTFALPMAALSQTRPKPAMAISESGCHTFIQEIGNRTGSFDTLSKKELKSISKQLSACREKYESSFNDHELSVIDAANGYIEALTTDSPKTTLDAVPAVQEEAHDPPQRSPSSALASTRKPYDGIYVTITGTWVNQHKVRIINGKNEQYNFMFTCNSDERSCKALMIGEQYQLRDDGTHYYRCDEYRLFRSAVDSSVVCLDDAN